MSQPQKEFEAALEKLSHALHKNLRQNAVLVKREREPRVTANVHPPQHALLLDLNRHETEHAARLETLITEHIRPLLLWAEGKQLPKTTTAPLSRVLESAQALQRQLGGSLKPQLDTLVKGMDKRHAKLDFSGVADMLKTQSMPALNVQSAQQQPPGAGFTQHKPLLKKNGSVEVLVSKKRRASLGDEPKKDSLPILLEIQQDSTVNMPLSGRAFHSARNPVSTPLLEEEEEEEEDEEEEDGFDHSEEARDGLGVTKWGVAQVKKSPFEIRRNGSVEQMNRKKREAVEQHPSEAVVSTLHEPPMPSLNIPEASQALLTPKGSGRHSAPDALTPKSTRRGSMPMLAETEGDTEVVKEEAKQEEAKKVEETKAEETKPEETKPEEEPATEAAQEEGGAKEDTLLAPPARKKNRPPPSSSKAGRPSAMELRKKGSVEQLMLSKRRASLGDEDPELSARVLETFSEKPMLEEEEEEEEEGEETKQETPKASQEDMIEAALENSPGSNTTSESQNAAGGMDAFVLKESKAPRRRTSFHKLIPSFLRKTESENASDANSGTGSEKSVKQQKRDDKQLREFIKTETAGISKLFLGNPRLFARYSEYTAAVLDALSSFEAVRDEWGADHSAEHKGKTLAELLVEPMHQMVYYTALLNQLAGLKQGPMHKVSGAQNVVSNTCSAIQTKIVSSS